MREPVAIRKEAGEFNKVWNAGFIELSQLYAKEYVKNPKNFIVCFLKYKTVRSCCEAIVITYKQIGAFKECQATGKDFSDYANKLNLSDKWKRVLAEILLIIYVVIN